MTGFGPLDLLNLYANGVFPMADSRDSDDVFIVDSDERGVIPLNGLKISKSLAKTVRSARFEVRINTAFIDVVAACATPRAHEAGTWINAGIEYLYGQLHDLGRAHSVECWQGNELVGGLYGVHLGAAFFGESMFSQKTNASKVALVHLVGRLKAGGFCLLDTQFITPHLQSLGAVEISRDEYHKRLETALGLAGEFMPYGFSDPEFATSVRASGSGVMQSKTQRS